MLPDHLKSKPSLKTIGYPRIEYYDSPTLIHDYLLQMKVRNSIIDMDDPTIPQSIKDNIEFTIDISDPLKHSLKMELKRNETLAQHQIKVRRQVLDQDKLNGNIERIDVNVLLLYIDTLSRAHFMRNLPKTSDFLSQFVGNTSSSHELIQYFRYHSVWLNSRINHNAMWYGQIGNASDYEQNLFKSFSDNGFVNAYF